MTCRSGCTRSPPFRPDHTRADEQGLAVILTMGDALAAHHDLDWAGIGQASRNRLGFSPRERHMQRVLAALDWLEARRPGAGLQPGVISGQDIALAVFTWWSETRGPIAWRERSRIEALVARLEPRTSFAATIPQPHKLDDKMGQRAAQAPGPGRVLMAPGRRRSLSQQTQG